MFEPQSLNGMVGNASSLKLLSAILAKPLLAPKSYIFEGPSGCGKTLTAKLFLTELTGEKIYRINSQNFFVVDSQEDLAGLGAVLFEDAHQLSEEQIGKLCDLLDQKSFGSKFVFCSRGGRLPAILRSRSLRVQFGPPPLEDLVGFLAQTCSTNDIPCELDALRKLIINAHRIPGVAVGLLNACWLLGGVSKETLRIVLQTGLEEKCLGILSHLSSQDFQVAVRLFDDLTEQFSSEEIIDELFTTYAHVFNNKESNKIFDQIYTGLSNYKKVSEIFIKWKKGAALPKSALILLLKELLDSNRVESPPTSSLPISQSHSRVDREIGSRELADIIHAFPIGEKQ
jgi:DNA polymerase III gamma/tau subunit